MSRRSFTASAQLACAFGLLAGAVTAPHAQSRVPPAGNRPSAGRPSQHSTSGQAAVKTFDAKLLAHLSDARINESSGLARGVHNSRLLWTHNDSGDGPYLFCIDRKGETIARCTVPGAVNVDWEDIENGPAEDGKPAIYIGDIGDNNRNRSNCVVYRIHEPEMDAGHTMQEIKSELPDKFPFRYPDGPHNAETLLVHPKTGEMVIVTKEEDGNSGVYLFPMPLRPSIPVVLERVGTVTFKSQFLNGISSRLAMGERTATGGDVSPDARSVIIRTYLLGYEWTIAPGKSIVQALKGTPRQLFLPPMRQGEAICYSVDSKTVYMTSEGVHTPLYELPLH